MRRRYTKPTGDGTPAPADESFPLPGRAGNSWRILVAVTLCASLLTGCASFRPSSTAIAGPSWQEREGFRFQQEGDDLGDRVEEAQEEASNRQIRWLWIAVIGGLVAYLAASADEDDEEAMLTFDAQYTDGQTVAKKPLRYVGRVQY